MRGYLVRINGRAWGMTLGVVFGLGLFTATNILVLRGGENMGSHLGLLNQLLPWYGVSFVGSLVGFAWAFVIGYVTGRIVALVYNATARE